VVGAVALAVLGACGVIVLTIPPRAHSSTSLASRSDWVLAGALPASRDFAIGWGYGISAPLRRKPMPDNVMSSTPEPGVPRAVYAPAACTNIPKILDHSGAALAANLAVDRYTELVPHKARLTNADATGELGEVGPNAGLGIWVVPDGPARIANYVDWLGHCGTYHVTNYDGDGHVTNERTVKTVVEARSANGADAAVTVTRTFTTMGSSDPPATYYVSYYAVRGVILECTIFMDGTDRDLVQRRAAETLQRLRAL
jgi:hypothetical protein